MCYKAFPRNKNSPRPKPRPPWRFPYRYVRHCYPNRARVALYHAALLRRITPVHNQRSARYE